MTGEAFYDQLAPFYHLIFPDWEASIARQATALDGIISDRWGGGVRNVLDLACGIGTQALGLAALGYAVTASDLSRAAVERARREAGRRGLAIDFSVADLRTAHEHHRRQFDLVLACDNAVPHLLTDADLLAAFGQMFACTRPGGGCLLTVRDYDNEERSGVQIKPYGVRVEGGARYLVFQVWEFDGKYYDLAMYFVEDRGGASCTTHVMRSRYYAVGMGKLLAFLGQAGFHDVRRIDGRFYQPVLVGTRP
jgi:SAM-dependent methyltransferase